MMMLLLIFSIDKLGYGTLPVDYCGKFKWVYYKAHLQYSSYNQLFESASVHLPISKKSLLIKLALFKPGICPNFL